jgi:diguanylate cyclase (GGDEF)-like protein
MNTAFATDELARQLLAAHQASPMLVALFDGDDVLRWANPAFRRAFELNDDELPSWREMMRANHLRGRGAAICTEDFERWLASATSRRGKLPFRAFEADLSDGRWIWMSETLQPNGWMLCVASEITSLRPDVRGLREAYQVALRQSQTDGLTGLSNRAHLMALLGAALADAAAQPLCVAALDLDHFKRINDTLGHAAGDAVIRDFALHLQASVRRGDGCGRVGGEEFVLVLPNTCASDGNRVLQRLMSQVRQARPVPGRPDWGYTCSAGMVLAPPQHTADQVLALADQALYAAKAAGRDRFYWATPPQA